MDHSEFRGLVTSELKSISDRVDRIGDTVYTIDESLRGNGQPGLKVRVDRLESWSGARKKFEWVIISSMFVILADMAYNYLK